MHEFCFTKKKPQTNSVEPEKVKQLEKLQLQNTKQTGKTTTVTRRFAVWRSQVEKF
jgi:hypothetical protein